jgi:hypothetical protein
MIDHNFGEIDQAMSQVEEQSSLAIRSAGDTLTGVMAAKPRRCRPGDRDSHSMIPKDSADRAYEHRRRRAATDRLSAATSMADRRDHPDIASQINLLASTPPSSRPAPGHGRGRRQRGEEPETGGRRDGSISQEIDAVRSVSDEVATASAASRAPCRPCSSRSRRPPRSGGHPRSQSITSMTESSMSVDEISRNVGEISTARSGARRRPHQGRRGCSLLILGSDDLGRSALRLNRPRSLNTTPDDDDAAGCENELAPALQVRCRTEPGRTS